MWGCRGILFLFHSNQFSKLLKAFRFSKTREKEREKGVCTYSSRCYSSVFLAALLDCRFTGRKANGSAGILWHWEMAKTSWAKPHASVRIHQIFTDQYHSLCSTKCFTPQKNDKTHNFQQEEERLHLLIFLFFKNSNFIVPQCIFSLFLLMY